MKFQKCRSHNKTLTYHYDPGLFGRILTGLIDKWIPALHMQNDQLEWQLTAGTNAIMFSKVGHLDKCLIDWTELVLVQTIATNIISPQSPLGHLLLRLGHLLGQLLGLLASSASHSAGPCGQAACRSQRMSSKVLDNHHDCDACHDLSNTPDSCRSNASMTRVIARNKLTQTNLTNHDNHNSLLAFVMSLLHLKTWCKLSKTPVCTNLYGRGSLWDDCTVHNWPL